MSESLPPLMPLYFKAFNLYMGNHLTASIKLAIDVSINDANGLIGRTFAVKSPILTDLPMIVSGVDKELRSLAQLFPLRFS